jgi:uncharacterized protein YbcI
VKTKGELEAEVSNAVMRFRREYMGRGPQDVRTYLLEDMALVRPKGVLTPAEQWLAQVEDPHRGRDLDAEIVEIGAQQDFFRALADFRVVLGIGESDTGPSGR